MRVDCGSAVSAVASLIKKRGWFNWVSWFDWLSCLLNKKCQPCKHAEQRIYKTATAWQNASHMYGHTLLELLIALPLGLGVTLAGVSLYRMQRASFEQIVELEQLTESGWAALHLIATHLRMAGFISPLNELDGNANLLSLFGCSAGRPIGAAGEHSCKAEKGGHSDGIEVPYQADTVSTWKSAEGKPTDCLGQAITTQKNPGEQAKGQVVNRFFARPSPSTGKPELYCEGSGRPGMAQPLMEGVERLHLRYQLANTLDLVEASAIADDQWNKVTMVQLCVVMQGTRRATYATYLDCDGKRIASADGLPRQVLATWVALRNMRNVLNNPHSPGSFGGYE